MWKALRKKEVGVRILLGIFVAALSIGMLAYLVPGQGGSSGATADAVAEVGGEAVTLGEVQRQLSRIQANGSIPRALLPLYAQQVVSQLVYQHLLELEAKRLGIRVTDDERAERIRLVLPTVVVGGAFVGRDQYATEVQTRFNMGVPEFEDQIRVGLLEEKFHRLV